MVMSAEESILRAECVRLAFALRANGPKVASGTAF
jgi:hypothetical protein